MALPLLMLPWETRVVVRTFKRGFGALLTEPWVTDAPEEEDTGRRA